MSAPATRLAGPAAQARAPQIAAVLAAAFPPGNQRWSGTEVTALLDSPGTQAILTSGGAALIRTVADEAELLTIAVAPDNRRHGEGRELLIAAASAARDAGADRLFLEVAADNTAALSLYLRHGFAQVGRRKGYYAVGDRRVDALVMACNLGVTETAP